MLAIKAARLFDGENRALLEDPVVLVEGERIAQVGPASQVPVPEDCEVLDFAGAFLMPGMIDLHVHLTSTGDADPRKSLNDPEAVLALRAARQAADTLQGGITSVRSMGAKYDIDIKMKRVMAEGRLQGPRITASGRCVTMTGGHGHLGGLEADGPWGVRQAVRSLLKAGADVIKVMATGGVLTEGVEPGAAELSLEELQAAVIEANNAGRRTATHAQGATGIRQAVDAGIDSIEHGCYLEDDVIERMAAKGTALVPTLSAPRHIIEHGVEAGIPQYAVDKTKEVADAHRESFYKAYRAGVRIGMGTDAGTPFNMHGCNAKELEYMADAGMSVLDVLRSATGTAAAILGEKAEVGRLQAGMFADLLVVDGNPLDNLGILSQRERIKAVFLNGSRK